MMFVLKLPILYLIGVVWWAVRAQPDPYAGAELVPAPEPAGPCPWRSTRTPLRPAPRGGSRALAARR
jgi:hypothetical protein